MMWQRRVVWSVALVCGSLVSACADSGQPGADERPMDPADVPQPYLEVQPGPGGPTGVVLETMNGGGYTYTLLDVQGEELWMAGPMSEIAVSDTLYLAGASNMGVFKSTALDRMWDEIYFIDAFQLASADDGSFFGTVTETMNVAGYTYVQVDVGDDNSWMAASGSEDPLVWLAGPEMALNVGDMLVWQGGSVMREFHSGTLNRTFAEIVFVGSMTVVN